MILRGRRRNEQRKDKERIKENGNYEERIKDTKIAAENLLCSLGYW